MRLRGNILLLFSLSLPIFTGIAFFFADLGYAFYIQNKMNNVTRRVALTAIQPWIYFYSPTSPPGGGTIASFQDIARKYFALEFPGITYDTPLTITQISSTVYRLKVGIKTSIGSFSLRTFRKQIDVNFDKNVELVLVMNQGVNQNTLDYIKTGAKNIINKVTQLPFFNQKMVGIIPYSNTISFRYPYLPSGFSNQNLNFFSLNGIDSESFKKYPFLQLDWTYTVNNSSNPNIYYYSNNPEDYIATIFSPESHCSQIGDPNHGIQIIATPTATYSADQNFLVSGPLLDGIYDRSDNPRNMGPRYIALYPDSNIKYSPNNAQSPTTAINSVINQIDNITSALELPVNLPGIAATFAWYMLSPKWQGLWFDKVPIEQPTTPLASSPKNKKIVIIFTGYRGSEFGNNPATYSSIFGNSNNYSATSLIPGPYHYPNMFDIANSPRYNQDISAILTNPTYGIGNAGSPYNLINSNFKNLLSTLTWDYTTLWNYDGPGSYNAIELSAGFYVAYFWWLKYYSYFLNYPFAPWLTPSSPQYPTLSRWESFLNTWSLIRNITNDNTPQRTAYQNLNWDNSANKLYPATGDGSFNLANYLILKELFLRRKMTKGTMSQNHTWTLPHNNTTLIIGHSMKCEGYTNAVCFNTKGNKTQNNGSNFFMPKYNFKVGSAPYGYTTAWDSDWVNVPVDTYRRQIFTRNTTGCVYTFIDTIKFWYDFCHTYLGINEFLKVLNFQGYAKFPLQPCPIPSDTNYDCTLAQQNVYYSKAGSGYQGSFANQTVDGVKYTYPKVGPTVPYYTGLTDTVNLGSVKKVVDFGKWNHHFLIANPHKLALILRDSLDKINRIGQNLIDRETYLLRNMWSPYGYLYPYGVTINGVKYTTKTSAEDAALNELVVICNLMKNSGIKVGFIVDSSLASNANVWPSLLQASSSLMPNNGTTGTPYIYGNAINDANYKGLLIATNNAADIPGAANQMAEMIAEICSEGKIISDLDYFI